MKIGFNCSSFDLFHAGHVTMVLQFLILAQQTQVEAAVEAVLELILVLVDLVLLF
jgi:nicotinic acid mononucleotide adenylyltransferase